MTVTASRWIGSAIIFACLGLIGITRYFYISWGIMMFLYEPQQEMMNPGYLWSYALLSYGAFILALFFVAYIVTHSQETNFKASMIFFILTLHIILLMSCFWGERFLGRLGVGWPFDILLWKKNRKRWFWAQFFWGGVYVPKTLPVSLQCERWSRRAWAFFANSSILQRTESPNSALISEALKSHCWLAKNSGATESTLGELPMVE